MFLRGDLPGLLAAGVGTGAADVNARYLDGFGTAVTTSAASKVLVTDGSGYLHLSRRDCSDGRVWVTNRFNLFNRSYGLLYLSDGGR